MRADPVEVAVAVYPREDVAVPTERIKQFTPGVTGLVRGGGVGDSVVHGPAGVVAEDERVLVFVP
ncbi:hypothetical protein GCM10020000_81710 [Streptomyces olivoverticillatus]